MWATPDATASCSHSGTLKLGSCTATTAMSREARSGFSAELDRVLDAIEPARVDERLAEAVAGVTAQLDESPRPQRAVVGDGRRPPRRMAPVARGWGRRQSPWSATADAERLLGRTATCSRDQSSLNSSESEFMQYRSPVGVWYASSNRWPRCEPQFAQSTSVRVMPSVLSVLSSTASGFDRLEEARPARAGVELRATLEQRGVTRAALVGAGALLIEQGARPRALGRGLAQDRVLARPAPRATRPRSSPPCTSSVHLFPRSTSH